MEKTIHTSLIIATLNRPQDLQRCLYSINNLTIPFEEIIIVEQGDFERTQAIQRKFLDLNIKIYFCATRSLAVARNTGIKKASGEFIFFLDDDAEINKDYTKVAVEYFERYPKAMGLTGYINEKNTGRISYILHIKTFFRVIIRIYWLQSFSGIKIARSGAGMYPIMTKKLQQAECLFGCQMVFRKKILDKGFRFNENFIGWSFGEDAMMSYQVYKYCGDGSLLYVPQLKITHFNSQEISIPSISVVRMKIIYRFIFWKQEVYNDSLINLLCYIHSQIGFTIFHLEKSNLDFIKAIFASYLFIHKNFDKILENKIDYNNFILNGQP